MSLLSVLLHMCMIPSTKYLRRKSDKDQESLQSTTTPDFVSVVFLLVKYAYRWKNNCFNPPVKYFTDRSKAVLLLWIFYVFVLSCVCYVFVRVCLYVLCGPLLGKGWPIGFRLWCLSVSMSLSQWYPGSYVVLDCIDSWSLHPYLLWSNYCNL